MIPIAEVVTAELRLADVARRWVAAEKLRRLRKREFGYAMVLLKKFGEEHYDPMGEKRFWEPLKDADKAVFEAALQRMRIAYKARKDAAAAAGSLRAAMVRLAAVPEPGVNADVQDAYKALCDSESQWTKEERAEIGQLVG